MTRTEAAAAIAKMGIRKNNRLTVNGYTIEKYARDHFRLNAPDGRNLSTTGATDLVNRMVRYGVVGEEI